LVWGSGGLGGGAGAKSEESEVQSDRCWAVLFLERARSTRVRISKRLLEKWDNQIGPELT